MEKSVNKNVESFIYTTIDEAEYYRSLYGGTIHTLQQITMEDVLEETIDNPLDEGLDNTCTTSYTTKITQEGNTYYVLNLTQQT